MSTQVSGPSGVPPPPTGAVASASPSSTSTSSTSSTNNATLYLYTFLATLVLLLSVSSAIVIRSLILRRRHQRMVEEAIRTGSWPPHHLDSTTGRRRRDFGQKPMIWETWLNANDDEDDGESQHHEKSKWGDIMPVYAAYVNSPPLSPQGSPAGSPENPAEPPSRPSRFMQPFTRRRSPPSPQPTTVSSMTGQTPSLPSLSSAATSAPAVRVAVLIAMPHPPQKHNDESGPPLVEIGVVEADVKDDAVAPSQGDSS